jgi:RNA polymerase sigma-70 factor (ECF subfamily)
MDRLTARRTDGELIARSARDAECFGVVFDRHFAGIHRYLTRRAGREVADELAVETFVVAFRRRRTYQADRSDARPWLFGIAANLLRDEWRHEQRQLRAWERAASGGAPREDAEGLLDRVEAQAVTPVVGAALASLEPGDRETLTLFAWAEMSYEEIADALAIPVGTVRSRMHRARKQVRAMLTAHGLGDVPVVSQREAR